MSKLRSAAAPALWGIGTFLAGVFALSSIATAQLDGTQPVFFRVGGAAERMEMIVNTSRIVTLEQNIPRMLVNNPEIITATPLSPNKVQVSARTPGVTQLNMWDENENVYTVDVSVVPDARELVNVLEAEFPSAEIHVRPVASSVILSGYVPDAGMVSHIVRISENYFPQVINRLQVGGVQQIALHVKVLEVSRTKLRQFGVDWAVVGSGGDFLVQSVSQLIAAQAAQTGAITGAGDTIRFGIFDSGNTFGALIDVLRQNNLAKLLSEPTIVTMSGRPASFNSGGEFPILVPQSLGTSTIEYRQFGTRVDFVPIVLGNGAIRLEVRPQVTERDDASGVAGAPALRSRWVDTAVEMRAGQTLALAGLIQNRTEAENRGIPWLADLPWVGSAFRRVEENNNEVELLIMVTPEFVEGMEPHEVPPCGPGQFTTSPNDVELYFRGYLEVPRCDGNCSGVFEGGHFGPPAGNYEELPPGANIETGGMPNMNGGMRQPVMIESAGASNGARRGAGGNIGDGAFPPVDVYLPASTTTSVKKARPSQPANRQGAGGSISDNPSEPGLLGPLGYDVLN